VRHEPLVLEFLRNIPEATTPEIAQWLNERSRRTVAPGTVLRVMLRLERFGSVQLVGERRVTPGRGGPAKVWRVT
jgi:hypothetical protein